jgi:cell division protein FtsI (penicillin-binding protein 3)
MQVPEASGRWLRLRVWCLRVLFTVLLAIVFGRAVQLQIFEQGKLLGMARDQYVRKIEVPARRGDIFDRRGVPLAQSVEVDSVWVDPSMLPDVKTAAKDLARAVHLDVNEVTARLQKAKRFAWVKRQITPAEVEAVKRLQLPGVGFAKEPRRFYPQRELAAHVIGFSGREGKGLEGLELAFDDELSGQNSHLPGVRDAKGRKLLTHGEIDFVERQGAAVTLTLDRQIQYTAEKALARAVEESKATAGQVVVLDPRTGELLAIANHPRFNPNSPELADRAGVRNRAALDTFEPGSTFKAFVVASALDQGLIKPQEAFFCENGRWKVGRNIVNDTHKHGWLTPAKILQVSSNICSAKIGQLLGRDRLVKAYQGFGFGERTGLSLPGEGRGVVPYPKAEISLATESFGQGLTATAVQIAAGYGALANGGKFMRPYLVSKVVDSDGLVLLENKPLMVRRAVSEKAAQQVVAMLETVVEKEGTAPKAHMDDYRVAGKTGTAQKADPVARGYSDKRIASFAGIVPADNPRLVILVVIDEPKTNSYGGIVAAPAFKEIAAAVLPYLGVPPSSGRPLVYLQPPEEVAKAQVKGKKQVPESKPTVPEAQDSSFAEAVTEQVGEGSVEVPDVRGKVGREAVARLLSVALEPRLSGSGRVVGQVPQAGTYVEKGTRISLELAARP